MQPRNRILDIYGGLARNTGGWVAISRLIELLEPLGIDEQAIRSAASRMKQKDLLIAEELDGLAGYRLSAQASEILADGDIRLFRELPESGDTSWIVAMFSVPESERRQRYLIRSGLARLGFGQGPAAFWFAPAAVYPETERMLRRKGLDRFLTVWQGEHLGFDDFGRLVADAWNFDDIRLRYDRYLTTFQPIADRWAVEGGDDRAAFVDFLKNLSDWRPLPYLDPGLPADVTPTDWPGPRARALFLRLDQQLRPQAMGYFASRTGLVTP